MAANNPPMAAPEGHIRSDTLSFGQHIANITAKADGRCRVLTSLTLRQWGWRKDQLTKIYKALYLSALPGNPG